MAKIEIDFIENIISIMKSNELTNIKLVDNGCSLYINAGNFRPVINVIDEEKEELNNIEENIVEKNEEETKKVVPIISNMIGVYFSKPSPNEDPFVKVGDKVKIGQQICIIETIKLMNNIVSDVSGIVKEICIEDGSPVEYGQTIMYIEQE